CQDSEQPATSTIIRLQRRVIGSIISEIGAAGYVLPALKDGTPVILCIPAAAVGAPHQRDRVWFVAHADRHRDQQPKIDQTTGKGKTTVKGQKERERQRWSGFPDRFSCLPYLAGPINGSTGDGGNDAEPHPTAAAPDTAH